MKKADGREEKESGREGGGFEAQVRIRISHKYTYTAVEPVNSTRVPVVEYARILSPNMTNMHATVWWRFAGEPSVQDAAYLSYAKSR